MEQFNVKLDENWVRPSVLARELEVVHSTVNNWIKRNKIDYFIFPGVLRGKHMVDRRTAPIKQAKGWPAKKAK